MTQFTGNQVDEAVEKGLKQLQLPKEAVEIKVLEVGKKGFFGIGHKDAVVEIKPLNAEAEEEQAAVKNFLNEMSQTTAENAKQSLPEQQLEPASEKVVLKPQDETALKDVAVYLTDISKQLNAPALVKMSREKHLITFHLDTDKQGLLIGKHGRIINALQYLAQIQIHHQASSKLTVVVNIGDYRERRHIIVTRLADKAAHEAIQTGRPVFLEPMPAFERKQVHAFLAENEHIKTYSEGDEPHRYLVVEPLKNVL